MDNSYSSLCDDFYVDMYVNTELELPAQRDTILAYFERIEKQFPSMHNFTRRETNDYCLEEDRQSGQYRWASLEMDRIGAGIVNPRSLEDAYELDRAVLELMPYMLSVSHLDVDSLDLTFTMDFEYSANHDEVIAEALLANTAFNEILDMPGARMINCSPAIVISLDEDCTTQARISIESKTSIYEPFVEKSKDNEAISLSFSIRKFPSGKKSFDVSGCFENICKIASELMDEKIIPNFVGPLSSIIAQKRSS